MCVAPQPTLWPLVRSHPFEVAMSAAPPSAAELCTIPGHSTVARKCTTLIICPCAAQAATSPGQSPGFAPFSPFNPQSPFNPTSPVRADVQADIDMSPAAVSFTLQHVRATGCVFWWRPRGRSANMFDCLSTLPEPHTCLISCSLVHRVTLPRRLATREFVTAETISAPLKRLSHVCACRYLLLWWLHGFVHH